MTRERNGAATVVAQEGSRVRVTHAGRELALPMIGFPSGFALRPGDRIIIVDERDGAVARPLVRAVEARLGSENLRKRDALEVGGQRLQMQAGTLLEEPAAKATEPATDDYVVWVVERGRDAAASQVIAVRRRR